MFAPFVTDLTVTTLLLLHNALHATPGIRKTDGLTWLVEAD